MKVYVDASLKELCVVACGKDYWDVYFDTVPEGSTHNEAEYLAIIYALENLFGDLEVFSDSQLAVNQINHVYLIRAGNLRPLAQKVWGLLRVRTGRGEETTITWIEREQNEAGKVLE